MTRDATDVVQDWFRAMQRGPAGEDELVALFADDAEYIEPFGAGGTPTRHVGRAAIRASLHAGFATPPPDLELSVNRMDRLDDGTVHTAWTCTSSAFPAPVHGRDETVVRNGKIVRLETWLVADGGAS